MAKFTPRGEILEALRKKIDSGEPIIIAGVSIGATAKSAEAGGADLALFYTSGRYRMAGIGSMAGLLAYGNANDMSLEMAHEIVPVIRNIPVIAGVYASDPYRDIKLFLKQMKEMNISGIISFPTVSLIDGKFRAAIEAQGLGYELELNMIKMARELDMLTTPYVFDEKEVEQMVKANADILIAHIGYRITLLTLEESVGELQRLYDIAAKINPEIIFICHSGPIETPETFEYVFTRTEGSHGFMGFTGIERVPAERAVKETTEKFKAVRK